MDGQAIREIPRRAVVADIRGDMPELAAGTVFAGYQIDGVAGEGGMGRVYRATEIALARPVALKLIADAFAGDRKFRERFQRASASPPWIASGEE